MSKSNYVFFEFGEKVGTNEKGSKARLHRSTAEALAKHKKGKITGDAPAKSPEDVADEKRKAEASKKKAAKK